MLNKFIFFSYLVALTFIFTGCQRSDKMFEEYYKSYPDDNVIEEIMEEIIESKLGVDIDLSSSSLEE